MTKTVLAFQVGLSWDAMLIAILSRNPLIPKKLIKRVRQLRKRPFLFKIRTKTNKENAMTVLWCTVIDRIEQSMDNAI